MRRYLGYFVVLLLLVIGVTFAVLNDNLVQVNYYIATQKAPLSLLLVVALGMGVLLGGVAMLFKVIRLRFDNQRLRRQVKKLKQEIKTIHSITGEEIGE